MYYGMQTGKRGSAWQRTSLSNPDPRSITCSILPRHDLLPPVIVRTKPNNIEQIQVRHNPKNLKKPEKT